MIREWRHVRLLKRMGRGHGEGGAKTTAERECAIVCPACPLPGINLPDNWDSADNDKRYGPHVIS